MEKRVVLERVEGLVGNRHSHPEKGNHIADLPLDDAGMWPTAQKILVTFHLEDLCLPAGTPTPTMRKQKDRYGETKVLTSYYYAELVRRGVCRRY